MPTPRPSPRATPDNSRPGTRQRSVRPLSPLTNLESGPFAASHPDGKTLREAVAYATDLEAIHRAVFYGCGDIATGYFPEASPWHTSPEGWRGKYDPDKAKFLLKKARAVGTV